MPSRVKNIKQLLAPGDVIEVGVKKLDKETVHLRLEQTPIVEGALVAVDPKTGAIRAMVGGYDFARSEYNRAVLARRQPGLGVQADHLRHGDEPRNESGYGGAGCAGGV